MRLARPLAIAITVLALAACGANAPGWTYAPAPSTTPLPSVEPSGSAGASVAPSDGASTPPSQGPSGPVVQLSALNIQFNTTELSAPANTAFQIEFQNDDDGIPHNVEIKDSAGRDRLQRRDLQRRRQAGLRGPGPRRRFLQVPVLGAPDDDRDADGPVTATGRGRSGRP